MERVDKLRVARPRRDRPPSPPCTVAVGALQVDKSILVPSLAAGQVLPDDRDRPGIWRILRTDWDEWLLDNCTHNAGKIAGITAAAVNGTIQNPRPRNRGL